ncbi:unnamed protein product [Urochloa humidicola]
MEEWRALAETAPGTCTAVVLEISGAGGLLLTVDRAYRMLGTVAATLQTLPPVAAAADVPADGAFPYALLEGAHRELARLYALHAGAGYVCGVIYVHTIKKVRGYLCTTTKVRDICIPSSEVYITSIPFWTEMRLTETNGAVK